MEKIRTDAHNAMFQSFLNPDPNAFGVYKLLNDIYPAFAEKIFYRNKFMEKIVMSNLSPMHILEYPICGRCETLAAWDGYSRKDGRIVNACSCFADGCGHKTINPITFKTWLLDELKRKAPPDIAEIAEYAVDLVAASMLRSAMMNIDNTLKQHHIITNEQMGVTAEPDFIVPYGDSNEHHEVTLELGKVDLNDEMKKIGIRENFDVRQIN